MAEDIQDVRTDLWKNTVVQEVDVENETALGFDWREIMGAITITFLVQSFAGAWVGKSAEATWNAIKRFFDQFDKNSRQVSKSLSNRPIHIVYRTETGAIPLEVVIEYANIHDLKRDLKNHPQYVALAQGYASAKLPEKDTEVSLLPYLPSEHKERVRGAVIRRASKRKQPNKK